MQSVYPFWDQNGTKTLSDGAAHTYIAYIREYPPGTTVNDNGFRTDTRDIRRWIILTWIRPLFSGKKITKQKSNGKRTKLTSPWGQVLWLMVGWFEQLRQVKSVKGTNADRVALKLILGNSKIFVRQCSARSSSWIWKQRTAFVEVWKTRFQVCFPSSSVGNDWSMTSMMTTRFITHLKWRM